MDDFAKALGRTIKVLRTERGMDRAQLADLSGISYPYLSEIENGKKRPSSKSLEAIAAALGMRAHELMEAAEYRRPEMSADVAVARSPSPLPPASPQRRGAWFGRREREMVTHAAMAAEPSPRAELDALLDRLSPEDLERVLDLVRRLAR